MNHMILKFLLVSALFCVQTSQAEGYPFRNPNLPLAQRVRDLTSRLTLAEKAAQMQNFTPAIERLNIPAYNWWNECLHGVGRSWDKVTVFPQAIAMAATFDAEALQQVGTITSTEARAIYNQANRTGKGGLQYKGLTFWTPNINIFRDPRWGRGQETYGEDPYLTGLLGKAIVRGLQGDDSLRLKTSACAKHFAVHSGPEPSRHVFDAQVSDYDLWDTYLPAFRDLIVDGRVSAVMGAYNRFRHQPCCASDLLMLDILRGDWNFSGYVTSDCGAIDDFFRNHKTHTDAASAAADAVLHTTDLDCGGNYVFLPEAVERGLITEAEIDEAFMRLMTIRFRLGVFDPEQNDPYATTPYSILESAAHQALALKMAHESMVLLKNNGLLPLSQNIRRIAILGPNADSPEVQLGNYNGVPSQIVTPLKAIQAKTGAQISYLAASNYTCSEATREQIYEAIKDVDLVIFIGGISPRLEGEEGDAGREKLDGFLGGDRTSILLPKVQTQIMQQIKQTNIPLIFVSMSGSAVAFPWEAQYADAILQAWYGGQAAGTAIADILWGDYNPSARLPVTFYASDEQLPDFSDYSMRNRTYRYFEGSPLYPFGYGLSYTTFEYGTPICTQRSAHIGESIKITTRVRNTGSRPGDEVVQLYVSHPDAPSPKPIRALKGVKRIHLQPNEEQIVEFTLTPQELATVSTEGFKLCQAGRVICYIGGSQPTTDAIQQQQSISIRFKGSRQILPR
ncbi:MAG: glycoside hydrolase family 3 C-terminal domain-containing protein [Alistipes sp.]